MLHRRWQRAMDSSIGRNGVQSSVMDEKVVVTNRLDMPIMYQNISHADAVRGV